MATTDEVKKALGVTTSIISTWRSKETFPEKGVVKTGKDGKLDWNIDKLKAWLRKWPEPKRGKLPSWFAVVGHKSAQKAAAAAA